MERIDFYVLPTADRRACELLACRLAEKAFGQQLRVFIHTRDRHQAEVLDELLWTFRQGSFLPHGLAGGEDEPIMLGETLPAEPRHDLLVNLHDELPPQWERYTRLAEVVDQSPEPLERARGRFKAYRERGYAPNYHKLETDS